MLTAVLMRFTGNMCGLSCRVSSGIFYIPGFKLPFLCGISSSPPWRCRHSFATVPPRPVQPARMERSEIRNLPSVVIWQQESLPEKYWFGSDWRNFKFVSHLQYFYVLKSFTFFSFQAGMSLQLTKALLENRKKVDLNCRQHWASVFLTSQFCRSE